MKRKHMALAIAALLVAAGFWLARSTSRSDASASSNSTTAATSETSDNQPRPGEMGKPTGRPAPPDPARRFMEFTPEQRVEFARRGHGPGG